MCEFETNLLSLIAPTADTFAAGLRQRLMESPADMLRVLAEQAAA